LSATCVSKVLEGVPPDEQSIECGMATVDFERQRTPPASTSKEPVLLLGECTINIKYNGKDVHLPLLVADDVKMPAIIGANWFSALNFNFNAIFIGIQFCRPITKEATAESTSKSLSEAEKKSKMRAKIVYDLDDIKPSKDLAVVPKKDDPSLTKSMESPSPPSKRMKIVFDLEDSVIKPSRSSQPQRKTLRGAKCNTWFKKKYG
jgi:hypothetical protein